MYKLIASGIAALSLLASPLALAQTYYPSPSSSGCIFIPAGISLGSRGSGVSTLQTFLVARNYPGGGSWMITGYFGRATAAAVRNFQQSQGLAQTGAVDAATASAISNAACQPGQGGVVAGASYPAPQYAYPYPSYPPYNNYYGGAPTITSLSQNTGTPGSTVTVYGVGFDAYNNTVNFGGTALSNIPSYGGTSLTFTVPSVYYSSYSPAGTTLQLSVSNGRGASNTVSFTMYGGSSGCLYGQYGSYPYGSCGCGNYSYTYGYLPTGQAGNNGYCPAPQTATPVISYLSPQSGPAGTSVSVYGSGFSVSGNTVHFGPGIIANLNSYDGRSVSFTVPNTLNGFGSQPITLSTYQVSVSNTAGITSNSVPFSVTGLVGSGAPTITSVSGPTSLAAGQSGTWTANVNPQSNSYLTLSVRWGDQNAYGSSAGQQTVYGSVVQANTLTHTYYQSGTYTIVFTVSNGAGQENSYTTTVVVGSGSYNYNQYPYTTSVSIFNFAFNPSAITVRAGTTITWTNNDSASHTVTSDTNTFASGTLSTGQSFSATFSTPGTYAYHCAIHPSMTGTVIVTQ